VAESGWDNRTFRLGDALTVRLPTAEWYVAAVAKEDTWLPRLAPHLPLPIPVPVALGARARGWALWKALITLAAPDAASRDVAGARRTLDRLLTDP